MLPGTGWYASNQAVVGKASWNKSEKVSVVALDCNLASSMGTDESQSQENHL